MNATRSNVECSTAYVSQAVKRVASQYCREMNELTLESQLVMQPLFPLPQYRLSRQLLHSQAVQITVRTAIRSNQCSRLSPK
jgi:hypothetical protein